MIVNWPKAFSGRTVGGDQWKQQITSHVNAKRVLAETPWQSEAWQKKYPMVRDLMNGDDNHNYLVSNLQLGPGGWGEVQRAILLGNRSGSKDIKGRSLNELKPHLLPWHSIPLDMIGPYGK